MQYLDKDGGYRDKDGGYFSPKASTYTDKEGGFVDNWRGYTYKDGSYKSQLGDYYNAPTRTVHFTTGENMKLSDDMTAAQTIEAMREVVAENGGYDKDYIRKQMMMTIKREHPPREAPSHLRIR